jgi:hypothetical protein
MLAPSTRRVRENFRVSLLKNAKNNVLASVQNKNTLL